MWDEHKTCQWHRCVVTSYAVTILTLEAASKTLLCQSLREGRKSDAPWSIWEETSQNLLLGGTIYDPTGSQNLVMHYSCSSFSYYRKPPIVSQHPGWLTKCMKQIYTGLFRWRPRRWVPGRVWQTPSWKPNQRSSRKGNLGKPERFALRKYITGSQEGNTTLVIQHYCYWTLERDIQKIYYAKL